jgi:hypothetical protein
MNKNISYAGETEFPILSQFFIRQFFERLHQSGTFPLEVVKHLSMTQQTKHLNPKIDQTLLKMPAPTQSHIRTSEGNE